VNAEKDMVKAPQTYDGKTLQLVPTPRLNLGSIKSVRLEASRVYKEMRTGKLEKAEGCKLVYALTSISKMIEADTVVKRIEALEGVVKR
jgi:hypothetical protein